MMNFGILMMYFLEFTGEPRREEITLEPVAVPGPSGYVSHAQAAVSKRPGSPVTPPRQKSLRTTPLIRSPTTPKFKTSKHCIIFL